MKSPTTIWKNIFETYINDKSFLCNTENAHLKNKMTHNPILRNQVEYLTKEDGQIDNKHIERCLTSSVSNIQKQTTIRCHFISSE